MRAKAASTAAKRLHEIAREELESLAKRMEELAKTPPKGTSVADLYRRDREDEEEAPK